MPTGKCLGRHSPIRSVSVPQVNLDVQCSELSPPKNGFFFYCQNYAGLFCAIGCQNGYRWVIICHCIQALIQFCTWKFPCDCQEFSSKVLKNPKFGFQTKSLFGNHQLTVLSLWHFRKANRLQNSTVHQAGQLVGCAANMSADLNWSDVFRLFG